MYGLSRKLNDKPCGLNLMSESLSDYTRRVMNEQGLTFKAVEQRSHKLISTGTINDIIQGRNTNPTVTTIKGLASGLGRPPEEVFAIALGKSISGDLQLNEMRLLEYFRQISPDNQDALLTYAEMMSQRSSAMERAKGAKLPVSSVFSQGSKRSSKKRTG
jgi:transcriptional regulator with XRE-family HTH domain